MEIPPGVKQLVGHKVIGVKQLNKQLMADTFWDVFLNLQTEMLQKTKVIMIFG